jgi:cobyrinic acid a,c-diamide synthase
MFRATLINWERETAQAALEMPPRPLGLLSSDEVRELLEQFRALDPLQNAEADPEVHLEVRRHKHVVRTGQGRLFLYDPRNSLDPALVLTAEEIIAELDGSAAAARTRAPFMSPALPEELAPVASAPRPVSPLRPHPRAVLAGASLCLAGYLAYAQFSAEWAAPVVAFEPLTDASQIEAHRASLEGVYMTGAQPGHHGIALAADGTMKLFQLNPQGPPSLIQDTYRVGRTDGTLSVRGGQPGGVIRVSGSTALVFCGETYQRVP